MESAAVRYQERQWVPWWIYPTVFVAGAAATFLLVGIDVAISGPLPLMGVVIAAAGLGVFVALMTLFSRAVITLDDEQLTVGREHVPLSEIVAVRPLRGRDVGRIRWTLVGFGSTTTSAGLIGSMIPGGALGSSNLALGLDMLRNVNRRRGMRASFWQRTAVLALTPGYRTKVWLLATRQPEALVQAIEEVTAGRVDPGVGSDAGLAGTLA